MAANLTESSAASVIEPTTTVDQRAFVRSQELHQPGSSLKIAHVTNYQVPGYGYDEIQLSLEQQRMGHEVTILTSNYLHPNGSYAVLRRRFPNRRVAPSDETVDGVRVRRLRGHEVARRVWIVGLERALMELAPDVIHSHNLLQFHSARIALLRAAGLCKAAVVIDDHMHFGFVRKTVLGRAFYSSYRAVGQPILAHYVDRFCAIADDTREYLRTDCAVKGDINVVPLGVTSGALEPHLDLRQQGRERLGVAPSDLVVLYVGKVIPPKGVHLLIEAAKTLSTEGVRVSVVVVGDSDESYEQRLMELAHGASGLDLHVLPSVEHDLLPAWYAAADVGVWPRQESKAVFEAMGAGLPVVVSSESGLADIVMPDRGLTYEAADVQSLTARLRELTDTELRKRLGSAGQDFARRELSWTHSAQRYVAIYREAIAARTRR